MYPTLYRLVDKGFISDRHGKVGKRRTRVYYHPEDSGMAYPEKIRKEYLSLFRGVMNILGINDMKESG